MKLLNRTTDSITSTGSMEHLQTLTNFPILMSCTLDPIAADVHADMIWEINKETGLIQLQKLIPLAVLYDKPHCRSVGSVWKAHNFEFSKFLSAFNPKSVLEVGGGNGLIADVYLQNSNILWSIVDPMSNPAANSKAQFITSLFSADFDYSGECDAIVHSHVFEHMYEPNTFISQIAELLDDGGYHIFTLPNLQVMFERGYTNCLNFEHTIFLTEPYIDYLLTKHGFRIIEKQYFKDDHSIFYATVKDLSTVPSLLNSELYEKNKQAFTDNVKKQSLLISSLNDKILNASTDVYLFGAHIFSQQLLHGGLIGDIIVCILDNDPQKQGKRLYGTNLLVESPNILKGKQSPHVVLNCAAYGSEIKEAILLINSNTVFLEQ